MAMEAKDQTTTTQEQQEKGVCVCACARMCGNNGQSAREVVASVYTMGSPCPSGGGEDSMEYVVV